jgi:hypothetical protein
LNERDRGNIVCVLSDGLENYIWKIPLTIMKIYAKMRLFVKKNIINVGCYVLFEK